MSWALWSFYRGKVLEAHKNTETIPISCAYSIRRYPHHPTQSPDSHFHLLTACGDLPAARPLVLFTTSLLLGLQDQLSSAVCCSSLSGTPVLSKALLFLPSSPHSSFSLKKVIYILHGPV